MNLKIKALFTFLLLITIIQGCGVYSMSGAATTAKSIAIGQIFNNADLAPANLGQTFGNKLRDYYQQNSNLKIANENGELNIEGVIVQYTVAPIAPVATGNPNDINTAALSRLTIAVKITYDDTLEPRNSFKDRQFSFYADFDNNANFTSEQQRLHDKIFAQILLDIFNATVANW